MDKRYCCLYSDCPLKGFRIFIACFYQFHTGEINCTIHSFITEFFTCIARCAFQSHHISFDTGIFTIIACFIAVYSFSGKYNSDTWVFGIRPQFRRIFTVLIIVITNFWVDSRFCRFNVSSVYIRIPITEISINLSVVL